MEHFETMQFDRAAKPEQTATVKNAKLQHRAAPPDDAIGLREIEQTSTSGFRDIFQLISAEIDYQADKAIVEIVQSNDERKKDDDGEKESTTARQINRVESQVRYFECCWMLIYAIVERLGEMYLKRSCLNGNIFQLAEAQRVFVQRCEAQRIVPIARLAESADIVPDTVCVSAMREYLRKAFAALCSAEAIKSE